MDHMDPYAEPVARPPVTQLSPELKAIAERFRETHVGGVVSPGVYHWDDKREPYHVDVYLHHSRSNPMAAVLMTDGACAVPQFPLCQCDDPACRAARASTPYPVRVELCMTIPHPSLTPADLRDPHALYLPTPAQRSALAKALRAFAYLPMTSPLPHPWITPDSMLVGRASPLCAGASLGPVRDDPAPGLTGMLFAQSGLIPDGRAPSLMVRTEYGADPVGFLDVIPCYLEELGAIVDLSTPDSDRVGDGGPTELKDALALAGYMTGPVNFTRPMLDEASLAIVARTSESVS